MPGIALAVVYTLLAISALAVPAILIFMLLALALNEYGMHHSLRTVTGLAPGNVLYILAHPDDEVMMAGTLLRLGRMGFRTHGLYLTRGEDGPTGGLVAKEQLGDFRERELSEAAGILGLASLEVLRFRDRHLPEEDQEAMATIVRRKIAEVRPKLVLGFDRTLGLYGHQDHVTAGRLARNASAEPESGVAAYLEMTLPAPQVKLAKSLSKTFRDGASGGKELPVPNLAVGIFRVASAKKRLIRCHASQWQVMRELLPFHHKIPAILYFLVFGREYYRIESFIKENITLEKTKM